LDETGAEGGGDAKGSRSVSESTKSKRTKTVARAGIVMDGGWGISSWGRHNAETGDAEAVAGGAGEGGGKKGWRELVSRCIRKCRITLEKR